MTQMKKKIITQPCKNIQGESQKTAYDKKRLF